MADPTQPDGVEPPTDAAPPGAPPAGASAGVSGGGAGSGAGGAMPRGKVRQTIYVSAEVLEGLKDAAYWDRVPFFALCEEALRRELARLTAARRGGYAPRRRRPSTRGGP